MKRVCAVIAIGLSVAICTFLLQAQPAGDVTPTFQTVMAAWKDRQDRVRAFRFTWETRRTVATGGITTVEEARQGTVSGGKPIRAPIPPSDTVCEFSTSLTAHRDRMSYRVDGFGWSHDQHGFVKQQSTSINDGELSKSYYGPGPVDHGKGFIYAHKRNDACSLLYTTPLLITYRALDPEVQKFKADSYKLLPNREMLDDRPCLLLAEQADARRNIHKSWWVDPARDFVVVRYNAIYTANKQPAIQMTLRHRQDPKHGWAPQAWRIDTFRPDGQLMDSNQCTVTDYQINLEAPAEEFQFEFPPGTLVYDHRASKEYIVRGDTSERIIEKHELGPEASYAKLVATDPANAWSWRAWLLMLSYAVVIVLGAWFLFRWFRQRPKVVSCFLGRRSP